MVIPIIFVLDSSGSMSGARISAVNTAMSAVRDIFSSMDCVENIRIGVMSFSSTVEWHTDRLVDVFTYNHSEISAYGPTNIGSAIEELGQRLNRYDLLQAIDGNISKPIIIFMSDGMPTDDWKTKLEYAETNLWFSRAVRLSIGVGDCADKNVMVRLTIPVCEIDMNGDWKCAARYLCVNTPEETIDILKAVSYYSVADGCSSLYDSSVVKSGRIFNNVLKSIGE